ncbi:DNA mismatch repair protein MutS [Chitinophaga dinghuensis]|uniref:DNA mismatch repair protein MutS n=1 Tax=Chitinophaga dinghuensis TaxID=1539050 RepID=A0A327WA09_9BACT|nr:hypothetical protein [Chitinophaga dinghuensis]RAJ87393.1 DNA mismatch repair protein MutS [Chitinophaga dinghuensis]
MPNVKDLEIKQLLPFFDETRNPDAREQLTFLILDAPPTVQQVYAKQQVIQTIIHNGYHHMKMEYIGADYGEVSSFLRRFMEMDDSGGTDWLERIAHYWVNKNERYLLAGGLRQTVSLLGYIEDYFSKIQPETFVGEMADSLKQLKALLARIQPAHWVGLSRGEGFSSAEQRKLMKLLRKETTSGDWLQFWQTFNTYEAWLSVARSMVKYQLVFPEFVEEGIILEDAYHLLLKNPVKNTLVSKGRVLLLTGPNMSGKSTLLKTLGGCVFLAHAGMPVPASRCQLPFFDEMNVVIQLTDDLKNGYSHFMMEVQQLKHTLARAVEGANCFAIFDELFRGTNVDDATDISRQTIEGLLTYPKGFFIISTHLHQLEELLPESVYLTPCYMDSSLEEGRPHFLYKLREGWGTLKLGRIIFEQEGLPALLHQWKSLT